MKQRKLFWQLFPVAAVTIGCSSALLFWLAPELSFWKLLVVGGAISLLAASLICLLVIRLLSSSGERPEFESKALQEEIEAISAQRNEATAILSSMNDALIAVGLDNRILNINERAADIFQTPFDQARGKSFRKVVENPVLQDVIFNTLSNKDSREAAVNLRIADKERDFLASTTILRDYRGEFIGALIVLRDVTDLNRLENIRRDFAANVSHELRTPITSIKGFVETLLDGEINNPENASRFLNIIGKQTDRLNEIIEDLLSLAKLEQGENEPISLEDTKIYPVIEAARARCLKKAQSKNIVINIKCDESLIAQTNPSLLEQGVFNLIDNAVHYSFTETSVDVLVKSDSEKIEIAVHDRGPGIAELHLPRIFERFYRVDKGRSRNQGGTGLGLAIVKHIAQVHGGYPSVESVEGKGSTFSLTIPQPRVH